MKGNLKNKENEIFINLSKLEELSRSNFEFSLEKINELRDILEDLFSKTNRVNALVFFSKMKNFFKEDVDEEKILELMNVVLEDKKLVWDGFYITLSEEKILVTKKFSYLSNSNAKFSFSRKRL